MRLSGIAYPHSFLRTGKGNRRPSTASNALKLLFQPFLSGEVKARFCTKRHNGFISILSLCNRLELLLKPRISLDGFQERLHCFC